MCVRLHVSVSVSVPVSGIMQAPARAYMYACDMSSLCNVLFGLLVAVRELCIVMKHALIMGCASCMCGMWHASSVAQLTHHGASRRRGEGLSRLRIS